MRKVVSVVWEFFERVNNEESRCVSVVCKLCENEYKFFGNTTNLRAHLMKKHPMQWQFRHGTLDVSELLDGDTLKSIPAARRRASSTKDNVRYSLSISRPSNSSTPGSPIHAIEIERIDVTDQEALDLEDQEATLNLVEQLNKEADEEWLEDDCEPIKKKMKNKIHKRIKKEVGSPHHYPVYFQHSPPQQPTVDSRPVKDEFSVFGEYIANKLRKFKAPRTRGNIQQLITTVLWQAEYGVYDNAESVKRLLMTSMQYAGTQNEQTENDAENCCTKE